MADPIGGGLFVARSTRTNTPTLALRTWGSGIASSLTPLGRVLMTAASLPTVGN
jgi:hypothetical protein